MKGYEIALLIVFLIVWVYILFLLKRKKLTAFYFMIGASGFFLTMFIVFKSILAKGCTYVLVTLMDWLSHIFKYYTMYKAYNIIFINHNDAAISLFIDYECSGVIEIFVVLAVILFFPLFKWKDKIIYSIIGIGFTMMANIVRLLVVTGIIYRYGNNAYYLAHSVVGRIIFYVLTLFLYFYLLSWKQIKAQKVGRFSFASTDKDEKSKEKKEIVEDKKETVEDNNESKS